MVCNLNMIDVVRLKITQSIQLMGGVQSDNVFDRK